MSKIAMSGGKGFGGGEATRDPAPTYVDPSDPKGKQQAIHKAESFAEYLARRGGGAAAAAPAAAAPQAAAPQAAAPAVKAMKKSYSLQAVGKMRTCCRCWITRLTASKSAYLRTKLMEGQVF